MPGATLSRVNASLSIDRIFNLNLRPGETEEHNAEVSGATDQTTVMRLRNGANLASESALSPIRRPADIDADVFRSQGAFFAASVGRFRGDVALISTGRTMAVGELERHARDFATYLQNVAHPKNFGIRRSARCRAARCATIIRPTRRSAPIPITECRTSAE